MTKRPVIGCGRRPGRSALEFSLFCRVKDSIDLGARSWVGDRVHGKGREHVQGGTFMCVGNPPVGVSYDQIGHSN